MSPRSLPAASSPSTMSRFDIAQNEFFALLGPSGCGKTTLLRMISGLETPTSGQIIIGGEDMALTPPNKRPTNMVFQSYAVFPHMTVEQNVAYGLKVTGVAPDEIKRRVAEGLEMVKLTASCGPQARPDVGRPAPARGPCPRAGEAPQGAAARRTAFGARCQAARRHADGTDPACRRRSASPSSSSPMTRTKRSPWPAASRSWTRAPCSRSPRRSNSTSIRRTASWPTSSAR